MDSKKLFEYSVDGKKCWFYQNDIGNQCAVFYLLGGEENLEYLPIITDALHGKQVAFSGFYTEDWNEDFSPWPAPAVFKKTEDFSGGGGSTLQWMIKRFLPETEEKFSAQISAGKRAILGYSLAGLFALWSLYNTDVFSACGCCSGSLWYDGWVEYAKSHTPQRKCRVYMSIGENEEKTKNARMAKVGDNTRETLALLSQNEAVEEAVLKTNSGGHFTNVAARLADTAKWLAGAV